MKQAAARLVALFVLLCACPGMGRGEPQNELYTRRFAFIVGANRGGAGRVTLNYAVEDARSIKNVLEDMGGVMAGDTRFLPEPDRETFFREIAALNGDIERSRSTFRRVEVIFYYSGHSDEENILLGGERISYGEFKDAVMALKADVRIAILDSCASGAMTLPKGVIRKSPFLLDTAYDMKGYAFMTSSSASEAAQESSRLKRSFFTHNLISGMRGAADMNQDGRITLNEAYQFAFDGTLTQTEKTLAGPQHPSYHIQMSGTGDVVITEIWKSSAVLVFGKEIAGKIYIHNRDNVLLVELKKTGGREISVGLEAGSYRIMNIDDADVWECRVVLESERSLVVERNRFVKVDRVPTRSRGDMGPPQPPPARPDLRWRIEIFSGVMDLNPEDLNLRAGFDRLYDTFYDDDQFNYQVRQHLIQSYTTTNAGGQARLLKHAVPLGIRFRYDVNPWLGVSFALNRFNGSQTSAFKTAFEILELDGSTSVYSKEYLRYRLQAGGYIPALGLHLGRRLAANLKLEAFASAGALFGSCSYLMDYRMQSPDTSSMRGDLANFQSGLLEEKGKGRGVSLEIGAKIEWRVFRQAGLFAEAGYAYQTVSSVSGSGSHTVPTDRSSWEGTWGIKQDAVVKPWGIGRFLWPSNAWEGFNGTWWQARDFVLDLSGFQLKLGLFFNF